VAPGVAEAVPAVLVIVSAGVSTGTMAWQGALMVPGGQVDPWAAELAVVMTSLPPVSGSCTVTENVTVAVSPGDRFPVHVSTGLANDTDPALAAASPL